MSVRTDDLSTDALMLSSVTKTYKGVGLERRREILVAEQEGVFAGFALLEISSPGINFSELANAFRVFALDSDPNIERSLIDSACQQYATAGRQKCVALAADQQISTFAAAGFELRKQYNCWTWHRSLYQLYCQHVLSLQRRK